MRLVYFGSGEFGLPTLRRLVAEHEVALVVTQPDRPAGRHRRLTPTPVATLAEDVGLPIFKPERPNDPASIERIHSERADAFVVIAYGHKLGPALLGGAFAVNLHASLLPKYRGAAPIHWAMIHNEPETGVSVIALAQRMDAGAILAQQRTVIDPLETAGELHDRLAALGPDAIVESLDRFARGTLAPIEQDESLACPAPKLSRIDGRVRFDQPANLVRARIHGLTPWPGCAVRLGGVELKLVRVRVVDPEDGDAGRPPGVISGHGLIACAPGTGSLELLEVQPAGGRVMSFEEYQRGHAVPDRAVCETP